MNCSILTENLISFYLIHKDWQFIRMAEVHTIALLYNALNTYLYLWSVALNIYLYRC